MALRTDHSLRDPRAGSERRAHVWWPAIAILVALGTAAASGVSDTSAETITVDDREVSLWTPDQVDGISLDVHTELPLILPPVEVFDADVFQWDAWPVRTWDGGIAQIDGWSILVGLSASRTPDEGPVFYTVSEWRYWFTNGEEWMPGGLIFEREDAFGSRQWAGSTRYDPGTNRISFFYTAVGDPPDGEPLPHPSQLPQGDPAAGRPPIVQQLALVEADVVTSDDGVSFENFGDHEIFLEADGEIYQTADDAVTDAVIYGFRDPWAFDDPDTGQRKVLFTANAAFDPGPQNGVIGVGVETDDGWVLEPPIAAAPGVSSQLERPHMVWNEDGVYLFWSTHSFTFADEGSGPEGLYGMFAESGDWTGPYAPLNGHGLVAGNPDVAPNQTYSYLVLPGGYVMSYLNQAGRPGSDGEIGTWVGGPSPLVELALDGRTTSIAAAKTPLGLGQDSDGDPAVPPGEPEPPIDNETPDDTIASG